MPKSAAEATPPAGNRFVEFDEFIDYQLTKASKSIQSTDVLVGVVGLALGLTVYLLVFILADHWLVSGGLGTVARGLYWAVGTVALGYWVTTRLLKPLNSRVNVLFAAKAIEKTQPGLKSSLLTLTDLKQAGRSTSGAIKGSLEKRAAVGLSKADVDEAVDRSTLMMCSYVLLFLLAVFCGYALVSPKSILQSAWRALVPFSATGVATKTRIDSVSPGDDEVPALSHLDVEVEVSGQAPKEAMLYYTTADRAFVDEAVPLRDTGEGLRRYRGTLIGAEGRGLRQNLSYYVTAGDATSRTYNVTVTQSPSAVVDSVAYEYQPYTGLANKEEPGGAIDAWEGTRVTVHATANQRVKSATVLFSDTENTSVKAEEQPMLIQDGTKLKASWVLAFRPDPERSFPKFYRVQLKTEDGHEDPQPTLQPLNIRPDLLPKAEIVFPKSDLLVPVNATIPIAYRASDPDFKLRSLVLNLEHDGKILPVSPRLFDGPPDEESREGTYRLKLKDLNLAAGSRLTYWLEARDNFMPFGERGGNKTLTPRLNIDLVEPQPPAQAQQQEKAADAQAQEALKENRPDQDQGEKGGEPKQGEKAKGSESAPNQEPMPGDNQDGKAEDGKQGTTGDSKDGSSQPDRGQPGENKQPMPGERSDDSKTEPNENSNQRDQGDRNGVPQPGDQGQPQPAGDNKGQPLQSGDKGQPQGDGQQGQPGQSDPGQQQQGKQGTNGPKNERNGTSGSPQDQQSSTGNRSGEHAPDDQALKELLKWNEKKQQEEQKRRGKEGSSPPESGSEGQPCEKEGEPKPAENKPGETSSDPMTEPKGPGTSGKTSDNPGTTGEKASDPSNDQASQKDAGQSGKSGEKPAKEPSKSGEKQGVQEQAGDKSSEKQTGSAGENTEPGQSEKQSPQGEKGASSEQSKSSPAGDEKNGTENSAGKNSNDQKGTGDQATGEKGADPTARPGDNTAKSPMKSEGAPGEKTSSQENPNQKTGATDSNSKGQESPTGESGDRKQPGDQNSKSGEKAGNSREKPAGQKDNEGTREAGEGDPGSSSPSQSGGQKTSGQGEAGKNGEKSSTGEKSGTGQSSNGKQGSKAGDGQGNANQGDSKKPQNGANAGKRSGQPGGDSKGSGEQSSGDKAGEAKPSGDNSLEGKPSGDKAGGDQQSGGDSGQKPAGEAGEKPGDKNNSGGQGGDQKQTGHQKQPGGQQGGDQKGGDQKGGGDAKGGDQKGAGEGGGGQGDGQPGKQTGSQSQQAGKAGGGMGGSGSAGSATEGTTGQSQSAGSTGTPDPANLEHRKKAANLALKRLQETLERGQMDPELQKELGFSDEKLRSFMDRLQERLADNGDDNSPEAQARRRQFESLLKGINLETKTNQRSVGEATGPAGAGFGAARKPAPREYRAAEQKYRESLNAPKSK